MTNELVKAAKKSKKLSVIEKVLVGGDLSELCQEDRYDYYKKVCKSLKLNPLTQPFGYFSIDGKMSLYAKKDCAEQLRKIHGVSITNLEREFRTEDNLILVTVTAKDATGRVDVATGVLELADKTGKTLKGKALANEIMKCETKAKRRVTLSICGLSMPDETELETMTGVVREDVVEVKKEKKTMKKATKVDEQQAPQATSAQASAIPRKAPTEKTIEEIIKALPDDIKELLKENGHTTVLLAARVYRSVEGDVDAMRQLLQAEAKAKLKAGK